MNSNTLKTKTIYIVSVRAGTNLSNDWFEYIVAALDVREARQIAILVGEDNNDFNRHEIMATDVQPREIIYSI